MYKFLKQSHYSTPIANIFEVQLYNKNGNKLIYSQKSAEAFAECVGTTIQIENTSYRVSTVVYDLITEKVFALCMQVC